MGYKQSYTDENMMRNLFRKLSGFYLILVALVVATQFTIEFTYPSSLKVWFVLDWFSLVGYAICVIVNLRAMFSYSDSRIHRLERLVSSVVFYVTLGLTYAFLHNFVGNLVGSKDDLLFWKFINSVQIPLFLATGLRLSKTHE